MAYNPQTWADENGAYPVDAERMTHIESGLSDLSSGVDPPTLIGGSPGDHVILAADNTLTNEPDYVDVLPALDNGVLMGMNTGGPVWTERKLPTRARRRGYLGWSFDPTLNGGGSVSTSG